ncbi:phosphatase PAP2 family protein [Streptomyces sp. NPDC058301]|uniref:phosphatase PAP2 family protein n=1 Tax=Streptomyces sp. NPDC058301 TaxID=3346436 RepID=UPI0036EFD3F0
MRYSDADHRLLSALRDCGAEPRVAAVARAFSLAGEHGAVWLAGGALAAAVDRERRGGWLRGAALVGAAHLASMGVKRVVRRPRPRLAAREPLTRTAGRHSFPSSHATSAAAAVVAYGALRPAGARLVPPLAAVMCVSRLVVGVHYPSDVLVGALLGAATARLGAGWVDRAGPGAGWPDRPAGPTPRPAPAAPGAPS